MNWVLSYFFYNLKITNHFLLIDLKTFFNLYNFKISIILKFKKLYKLYYIEFKN